MTDTVLRLEIRGLVQGVGYRWAMVEQARRLDLRGWVRNRRDGSVEAVVAGMSERVVLLADWARIGPPSARVHSVEVHEYSGPVGLAAFEARPTA